LLAVFEPSDEVLPLQHFSSHRRQLLHYFSLRNTMPAPPDPHQERFTVQRANCPPSRRRRSIAFAIRFLGRQRQEPDQ
jgi:hypothetical protein